MSDRDPEISELLASIVQKPRERFWHDVDVALELEVMLLGQQPNAQLSPNVGLSADEHDDFVDLDLSLAQRSTPEPSDPNIRWQVLVVVAAALVLIGGIVGVSLNRPAQDVTVTGPDSDVIESTVPADGSAAPTTGAGTTSTPPGLPDPVDLTPARLIVATSDVGSFGGLTMQRSNDEISILTTHQDDVAGQPLVTNVVSDGAGGFVYGLIDFDDSRSDRSSRLIHVPAGTDRPVVLAEEAQDGIGFVAGVVQSRDGRAIVYGTLVGTTSKIVPLVTGAAAGLSTKPAVAAAGDVIVVVNDDSCRSFELLDPTGAPSARPNPRPPDTCSKSSTAVFEVALSADGTRLAWVEGDELRVADLDGGGVVASVSTGSASNVLMFFDGRRALIAQGDTDGIREIVVDVDGSVASAGPGLAPMAWSGYSINPELTLGLETQ